MQLNYTIKGIIFCHIIYFIPDRVCCVGVTDGNRMEPMSYSGKMLKKRLGENLVI